MPHPAAILRILAGACTGAFVGFLLSDTHPHALMSPEIEMLGGGVLGLVAGALWARRLSTRAAGDASPNHKGEHQDAP